jgi:hypothetical protein
MFAARVRPGLTPRRSSSRPRFFPRGEIVPDAGHQLCGCQGRRHCAFRIEKSANFRGLRDFDDLAIEPLDERGWRAGGREYHDPDPVSPADPMIMGTPSLGEARSMCSRSWRCQAYGLAQVSEPSGRWLEIITQCAGSEVTARHAGKLLAATLHTPEGAGRPGTARMRPDRGRSDRQERGDIRCNRSSCLVRALRAIVARTFARRETTCVPRTK